jgi:hypothetical protein
MAQERLSDLAIVSIEDDVCKQVNFDNLIQQFAVSKAWKVYLEKLSNCFQCLIPGKFKI